jgi:lipopolysaccharide export system protein LptA
MEWFIYLLKVSTCTGLFYAFYYLFLRKLTFFNTNRSYLLLTLILSITIPALQLDVEVASNGTTETVSEPGYVDAATGLAIPKESYLIINSEDETPKGIDWHLVLPAIYIGVAMLLLANFLFQVLRLLFYTRNVFDRRGMLKIILKPDGFTNCSFFNYVFVDQKDLSSKDTQVFLQHEKAHAMMYHSADKLLIALFRALLWFNPFIYLYERELNQLHEYEADRLSSQTVGHHSYAMLLLEKATKRKTHLLVHSFAVKPLKARILMLFNNQSNQSKKLWYLAALPIIATLLFGFSVEFVPKEGGVENMVQDPTVFRQKIKPRQEMVNSKKAFDAWTKTAEYREKNRIMDQAGRKTLTGLIKYNSEPVDRIHANSVLFVSNNTTYLLMLSGSPKNIRTILKDNSTATVKINFAVNTQLSKYVELMAASIVVNGKQVYSNKPSGKPAFSFYGNKVRFTDGVITKVNPTSNGQKELNISANGYAFVIKLNDQQVSLTEFDDLKAGEKVRIKFVNELKTSGKAYLIKDWVSISDNSKSDAIKNKLLFAKFYEQVDPLRPDSSELLKGPIYGKQDFGDKVNFSAKDSVVVDKSGKLVHLYGNARITLKDIQIRASKISYYIKDNVGVAKDAVLERKGLKSGPSDSISFNLNTKKYNLYGIK